MNETFQVIAPALAAGLVVLASHVPLGMRVLARGIIFLDLALAQIAGLGAIAAYLLGEGEAPAWQVQLAAVVAALLAAAMLTWSERRWPRLQEALIGTAFVLAASGVVLLLARDAHGGEHVRDLLVGQILWVSQEQIVAAAAISAAVLIALRLLGGRGFYVLFAVAVTVSVQLVGVYLVFASLILPALAAHGRRRPLAVGYAVAAAGYVLGLALSALHDLPAGAVVVWTMAFSALVGAAVAPRVPVSALVSE